MGKRGKKRRRNDPEAGKQKQTNWDPLNPTNAAFEDYYKKQGIMPPEEWDEFMAALRRQLPSTFRITGTRSEALELRDIMKNRFFSRLENLEIDGVPVSVPKPLPWYPHELGWHFGASRSEMRKSSHFSDFHTFLVQETELGNVSRQEAVSMLPPMLLDVQSHHRVLDMCAAPGSKTSQLIEFLHTGCGDKIPEGFVIANDDNQDRCYMLIHQTKRLKSPCTLITNHDASFFPSLLIEKEAGISVPLQFDRILADVPCSGDATLRKNPLIWQRWSVTQAAGLHKLQIRILQRGCQLLKVGGRIVFSTCSLNPMENESVVAAILAMYPDSFELVDVSDQLAGLKRNPGMLNWKVISKEGEHFNSFEDLGVLQKGYLYATMFPPSEADAAKMHLERCIRVLPHHQDTGGFFVAVLHKKASIGGTDNKVEKAERLLQELRDGTKKPEEVRIEDNETEDAKEEQPAAEAKEGQPPADKPPRKEERVHKPTLQSRLDKNRSEAPFLFVEPNHPDIASIRSFFKLHNFPLHLLLSRSDNEKKRQYYFVSEALRELMLAKNKDSLKVINTGLKLFVRNENMNTSGCDYRLGQEGIHLIVPYLEFNKILVKEVDFIKLMQEDYPLFSEFTDGAREQLEKAQFGSCIFVFDPATDGTERCLLKNRVYVAGWRGKNSGSLMISKKERISFLHRFENIELSESLKSDKKGKAKDLDKKDKRQKLDPEAAPQEEENSDEDQENDNDNDNEGNEAEEDAEPDVVAEGN